MTVLYFLSVVLSFCDLNANYILKQERKLYEVVLYTTQSTGNKTFAERKKKKSSRFQWPTLLRLQTEIINKQHTASVLLTQLKLLIYMMCTRWKRQDLKNVKLMLLIIHNKEHNLVSPTRERQISQLWELSPGVISVHLPYTSAKVLNPEDREQVGSVSCQISRVKPCSLQ